jgi:hypothetical protein
MKVHESTGEVRAPKAGEPYLLGDPESRIQREVALSETPPCMARVIMRPVEGSEPRPTKHERCPACQGTGKEADRHGSCTCVICSAKGRIPMLPTCGRCRGKGKIPVPPVGEPEPEPKRWCRCWACLGTGEEEDMHATCACGICRGTGRIPAPTSETKGE